AGIVALGCIIRGETYHFEIVSNESARALMDLGITHQLALGNGILTTEDEHQAIVRADPAQGDKGGDAARVVEDNRIERVGSRERQRGTAVEGDDVTRPDLAGQRAVHGGVVDDEAGGRVGGVGNDDRAGAGGGGEQHVGSRAAVDELHRATRVVLDHRVDVDRRARGEPEEFALTRSQRPAVGRRAEVVPATRPQRDDVAARDGERVGG
ncbi:MAG: hypothetical protein EBR23_14165, partial [Planctomycetia bacterium]|nr:hypothetical protein [Planctomycetia bacterium]